MIGTTPIHRPRLLPLLLLTALAAVPLAALTAAPLAAQDPAVAAPPAPMSLGDRLERAAEMLRTHRDTTGVAGLSAAIAVDGRLAWAGGFGYADLTHRVEAGPEMVSRIGSISKPVAAVMAMALRDRGLIDLDVPISTYLPDYPGQNAGITMRQLMSHTAGVRHYNGDEFMSDVHYEDVLSPLAVFWADSLLFEPGTAWSYTTYGWTVVSAVTDAADPTRSWLEILEDEVLDPLGLTTMQPGLKQPVILRRASYYYRDSVGVYSNAPQVDLSNKWAGGGLISTTADMVRFALGVLHGEVLSDGARAEMWRRQTPEDAPSYGLGWYIGELDGHRTISHGGGSVGATAMLLMLPDDGVVVAILGNTGDVGHGGIAAAVARLFLD